MMITISFDNIADAKVAIKAVEQFNAGLAPVAPVNPVPVTTPADDVSATDSVPVDADITPGKVAFILKELADMSKDELANKFGSSQDKPYRVLKARSFKEINDILGLDATDTINTYASLNDIKKAIDIIIKDVSDGGLSHDDMEDLFGVRTSKNLFKDFSLDEIVRILKEEDYI